MNSKMRWFAVIMLPAILQSTQAQVRREDIYSASVLYQQRTALEKDLRERITGRNMSLPLDSNSEDKYMSSCWAVSQFLIWNPGVEHGFDTLFHGYDGLSYDTKRAFLEGVYAVAPERYADAMRDVLEKETDPKLFALCAVYLYRIDTSTENGNTLKIRMVEKFPDYDSLPLLHELADHLTYHAGRIKEKTPDMGLLFSYQRSRRQKTIYSFQRWDRDYPGLAVVQGEDGRFVRDGQGKLQVFQQLARSGSDLPYFITNGSTPQGIYSIQGTDVSRTNLIGPTPNLQLLLPFEGGWGKYFHMDGDTVPAGQAIDSLGLYQELLPRGWRDYTPMTEAWSAGHIGRTEIIAHGTTIDPEYFKDKPFYPLTPTMGCLCARELWNPTSGHPLVSEQLGLVNAWSSTPANGQPVRTAKGYLYVINVDDQRRPVSRAEVEAWVSKWEKSYL